MNKTIINQYNITNPKITNDRGEYYQITIKEKINKKPVHIRLYEDNKDRENFHKKKESLLV